MRYVLLFLAVALAAPFSQAQKPSDEDKSADAEGLLGTWEYTVRPDDPMAEGTFEIVQGDDQIDGMFNTDAPRKMTGIELTETSLSFSFSQPGMGVIAIGLELVDGSLTGTALPEGADEPITIVAIRPSDEPDSSED